MFHSLRTDHSNAFDRIAYALVAFGVATFALTVILGFGELTGAEHVVSSVHGVVTTHIVSLEPVLSDLGGSLVSLIYSP